MKKICEGLIIGNQDDLNYLEDDNEYALCLAAKTFHQMTVGYTGNLDKNHEHYLIFEEPDLDRISFNLIDAPKVEFIPEVIINAALKYIENMILKGKEVFLCCNQGRSRSACIGLMYLMRHNWELFSSCQTFEGVEKIYSEIYPMYEPNAGMRETANRFFLKCKNK